MSDITQIPDAALWAELVRRTLERERTGEDSIWPSVTLEMAYGEREPSAAEMRRKIEAFIRHGEAVPPEVDTYDRDTVHEELRQIVGRPS